MIHSLVKQHRFYWEDADHLIELARDYDTRIGQEGDEGRDDYYRYWKYRLARMSFIARMMAVEALLNNTLEAFGIPEQYKRLKELKRFFTNRDKFPGNFRKRKNRPYQVPLKWKLYFTPYLCNENCLMTRDEFFEYDDGPYRKFRMLIMIRNEFVHTHLVDKNIDIHFDSPASVQEPERLASVAVSTEYSSCCEEVGIGKDPVCFMIDNARVCGRAMAAVVRQMNDYLDGRILTEDFWHSEDLLFDD